MGYSGYKDKDSSNILNKYQLIKESNNFSNKQSLNEVAAAALPAVGALWNWLVAAGVTGSLLALLQQAFSPEVVKQMESQLSNIANQFELLVTSTTSAATVTALNTIASLLAPISKTLSNVFTGYSKLITDAEQGKITEEQALNTYKSLTDQYYKAGFSFLSQIQYSKNPTLATLQKQIVKYITVDMTRSQEQEREDLLKRIDAGNQNAPGPEQPQGPKKPDDKDPLFKRIGNWIRKNKVKSVTGLCIVYYLYSKEINYVLETAFAAIKSLPSVKYSLAGADYLSNKLTGMPAGELARKGLEAAGNFAIGKSPGEGYDIFALRKAEELLDTAPPDPEELNQELEQQNQNLDRFFSGAKPKAKPTPTPKR